MTTLEESAKANERLAMTLPSDITDFETKIFGAVERVAVESSEGIGLVRIKDLQGEKTDSVTIPKEQSPLVPTDVSEGSVVTPSKVLMDKKVISLSKRWEEGFALSQDAIDDRSISEKVQLFLSCRIHPEVPSALAPTILASSLKAD